MRPESGNESHAVCLAYQAEKPAAGLSYFFEGGTYAGGARVPQGYCVPIDYDNVGALSNTDGSDWELIAIRMPEEMYGKRY